MRETETIRLRRAQTLLLLPDGARYAIHNYRSGEMFFANAFCLALLGAMEDWRPPAELFAEFSGYTSVSLAQQLGLLLDEGAVVAEGTALDALDRRFTRSWPWGVLSASYHFAMRDTRFLSGKAAHEAMVGLSEESESPPLIAADDAQFTIELPAFSADTFPEALSAVMLRRRSCRDFSAQSLSLEAVANCLFAGKGITGWWREHTEVYGELPQSLTPSGGARNPFDLYLVAKRIHGLQRGMYRYCGWRQRLAVVGKLEYRFAELFGDQEWAEPAAAFIVCVANFQRTGWKYRHEIAYRVVCLEVGCIVQNLLLAATAQGLACVPSGAINFRRMESALGLDPVLQAPLMSVALGLPESGELGG